MTYISTANFGGSPTTIVWDDPTTGVGLSGSFTVDYVRDSGTLGPASFSLTYQFSSFSRAGDLWRENVVGDGYRGPQADIGTWFGTDGMGAVDSSRLPSSNRLSLLQSPQTNVVEESAFHGYNSLGLQSLGTFNVTTPSTPNIANATLTNEALFVQSQNNQQSGGVAGYYTQPLGGMRVEGPNASSDSELRQYVHGDVINFEYTAWSLDPSNTVGDDGRTPVDIGGIIIYDITAVPEPSGALLFVVGGIGVLLRRKR